MTAVPPDQPPFAPPTNPASFPPPNPADRVAPAPRWGMPDIVLGAIAILVGSTVALVATAAVLGLSLDETSASAAALAVAGLGQQGVQFGWPVLVARWKGYGIANDFRFRFALKDLLLGPALGLGVAIGAGVVGLAVAEVLGVTESDDTSNTAFLSEHRDSPWFYAIVFMVIVGAPLSEELFFRGLAMSAIEKRFGSLIGLLGSSVLFVLPHYTNVAWRETLVIFSVIGVVALCLGAVTQRVNRLGPAIIAHMTFNSIGVLASLATGV
ncbi:MAG: type II CAAX endopeptidase family protein [Acidimicrobiales bacterium]